MTIPHTIWRGVLILFVLLSPFSKAAAESPQLVGQNNGVVTISEERAVRVSFPTAMVNLSEVDVESKNSPIRFNPPLKMTFMWKSQTEGVAKVEGAAPGAHFDVHTVDSLKDLTGKSVPAEKLGVAAASPFKINAFYFAEKVAKRPSVPLAFSHPVRPKDLTNTAWFQDRDSRERYPVDVVLPETAGETVTDVTVTPRSDLPGGRTFDLIIDGIAEAESGVRSSELFIEEIGKTESLRVEKIAAFNHPMKKRRIAVEFSEGVDPAEGRKIQIDPPVANVEARKVYQAIWLEGDFDLEKRYRITVPKRVVGQSGFAMAEESRWSATFHAKKPALIFPREVVHQRSRLGMNFSFMQVNTGALEWKLAKVPPEKLLAINQRIREFDESEVDPATKMGLTDEETGWPKWKKTELLIESSRLETVSSGSIESSEPDADTLRKISWKPDGARPAGSYVLEITGKNAEGKTIGNRALITFTEYSAVQKHYGQTVLLRVMNVTDGKPAPGMKVRAITEKNELIAESGTDPAGFATFPRLPLFPASGQARARWFVLETPDGPMLQRANADQYERSGYSGGVQGDANPEKYRIAVATDRPLYRPGQTVKFKAFAREIDRGDDLRIPRVKDVSWAVSNNEGEEVANGSAKLDAYGGFDAEWNIPAAAQVGEYGVSVKLGEFTAETQINVQEFRPPPFLVSIEDLKLTGAEAGIRISSNYFHGAANAGATVKWKAVWTERYHGDSKVIVTDVPRLASASKTRQAAAAGEGVLNTQGLLEVRVASPFNDGIPRAAFDIEWTVEATAADAQTITEYAEHSFFTVPIVPRLSASQAAPETPGSKERLVIAIDASADSADGKPAPNAELSVDLYRVSTKTAKEQISENIFRYRNSTTFEKRATFAGAAPLKHRFPVPAPGEYLVTARDATNPAAAPAFAQTVYVAGEGQAEFPIADEDSIGITHPRENAEDDAGKAYLVGETAPLSVQAPFPGIAWVSIEAEGIIDTLMVPLEGNSGRLEVPIKPEYAPNAFVSVYLLSPGGDNRVPAERFGSTELHVRRLDRELLVLPVINAKQVRPKEQVAGFIQVTLEGRPVKDADLTVYAVDESILDAGDWHEPALREAMFPQRAWRVSTHRGLERLSLGVDASELHQKGFIIGAGEFKSVMEPELKDLRTNFPPLAFWQTRLRTDKDGKVPFSFPAPDALTKYRVVALAQTKQSQFGTGSDWVEISKPVQIEPALPRFVRSGDEVELRAIVRQKVQDEMPVTVRCVTNLTLGGSDVETQNAQRNRPAVFRFRAKVGDPAFARIQFSTEAGPGDAVELMLPVHPPTLLRKETVTGNLAEIKSKIPKDWSAATGKAAMIVSTSPWLPKLSGIPLLMEYPHGCFEQVTSRVLVYTNLSDLIAYLPQPEEQTRAYRKRIEAGIERMAGALHENGCLPYWPGGEAANLPTIAGFWAVRNAKAQGFAVPDRLLQGLSEAVVAIAKGERQNAEPEFMRAYSLFVLSEGGNAEELGPMAREMYLRREKLDDEARALLALAMHRMNIMATEKKQLLREIDRPVKERAFDPETFSSTSRAEAIRAMAFATIKVEGVGQSSLNQLRKQIGEWLDAAQSFSTQENIWLLMAFKAMNSPAASRASDLRGAQPAPSAVSRNGASAAWADVDIRKIQEFSVRIAGSEKLAAQLSAEYRGDSPVTDRSDRGFRVERVVKNLTDKTRTGAAQSPFRLGDQILITYRLVSPKLHHYVALDSELPAGLETVNPNIASIARTYSIPQDEGTRQLSLSFSEIRDRTTCLYFDRVEPGAGSYSVLARATSAGVFNWPATQVTPMYDSRFSGLSPSSVCYVSAE